MTQLYECRLHCGERIELPADAVALGKPHGTLRGFQTYRFSNKTFHQLRPIPAPPEPAPEITVIISKPPRRDPREIPRPQPPKPPEPPASPSEPEWVPDLNGYYSGWFESANLRGFFVCILDDSLPFIRAFVHCSNVVDRPDHYVPSKGDRFSLRLIPAPQGRKIKWEAIEAFPLKTETTTMQAAFEAAKDKS